MINAGLNGFGRFGQHLLRYWLEHIDDAKFEISYINDPSLSLEAAYQILTSDSYLGSYFKAKVHIETDGFSIIQNRKKFKIIYTNSKDTEIEWLGIPRLFFECSGKNTDAENARNFITANTELVIISATSLNADQTLIYGHNHQDFTPNHVIVSYGSCTVNAYVPLADYINQQYGVIDSSVDVIHNIPEYLAASQSTLTRKLCTLQVVAPKLLDFISKDNFNVNYTLIPYTGVSMIDFRFRIKTVPNPVVFIKELQKVISQGSLHGLYELLPSDLGPEAHKFSRYSSALIESGIKIVGDNLYMQAYFDNENSVNRYYDLVEHIITMLKY